MLPIKCRPTAKTSVFAVICLKDGSWWDYPFYLGHRFPSPEEIPEKQETPQNTGLAGFVIA